MVSPPPFHTHTVVIFYIKNVLKFNVEYILVLRLVQSLIGEPKAPIDNNVI